MSKSILITGGAGFIGSHFLKRIMSRNDVSKVILIDYLTYAGDIDNISNFINDPRLEFVEGNITDATLVDFYTSQVSHVAHFAAETHVTKSLFDSRDFIMTDIVGTHNILNAVVRYKKQVEKFLHISTSEVYGTALDDVISEKHALNPLSPYAGAKCGADRLVYSFIKSYELNGVILRPFNNYGPNQHLEKLIPRLITSAICNLPISIHGDGSAKRDWVYVEDTVQAAETLLFSSRNNNLVYNFGTGSSTSVLEIAELVMKLISNSQSKFNFLDDRPGQVNRHTGSNDLIYSEFGIKPTLDLNEGLLKTTEWYLENKPWWEKRWNSREIAITLPDGKKVLH